MIIPQSLFALKLKTKKPPYIQLCGGFLVFYFLCEYRNVVYRQRLQKLAEQKRILTMPRAAIIKPDQSYTFSDYFKLNFAPKDILAHFGVSLQRRSLRLPQYTGALDRLEDLKLRIEESLPRLS